METLAGVHGRDESDEKSDFYCDYWVKKINLSVCILDNIDRRSVVHILLHNFDV